MFATASKYITNKSIKNACVCTLTLYFASIFQFPANIYGFGRTASILLYTRYIFNSEHIEYHI